MEILHVLNRGVEKREVFLDDQDRLRFIQNLYIFNDVANAPHSELVRGYRERSKHKRNPLVHIYAFCLMPNHYHLLLSPVNNDFENLSLFMKKINGGYAKYFNEKYKRSGYLWQGKYKKIVIERDGHFLYIPHYIHLNPLDLKYPQWRKGKVKDTKKALEYLQEYRWSSYLDYTGHKNFPSLLHISLLSNLLGSQRQNEQDIKSIIKNTEAAEKSWKLE